MKLTQRLLMGIGGLAAAAALLTTVSPKAHALAATLVEVVNTRSTPVPNQDVDHPGRHPYQQTCGFTSFQCQMPVVPPNTEVVIQSVSIYLNGGSPTFAQLATFGAGQAVSIYIPLAAVGGGVFTATQTVNLYEDPGTGANCSGPINSGAFACTITGYTVSLP
jgi:hypothetical protein